LRKCQSLHASAEASAQEARDIKPSEKNFKEIQIKAMQYLKFSLPIFFFGFLFPQNFPPRCERIKQFFKALSTDFQGQHSDILGSQDGYLLSGVY